MIGTVEEAKRRRFSSLHIPEPNSGCWLWIGHVTAGGYGRLHFGERCILAHRLSWELHNGSVSVGLFVCHKCDNKICVNPDHLFLGTREDNNRDRDQKSRQAKGERSGQARLTEAQVLAIRRDGRSFRRIARAYGVSAGAIEGIKAGRTWKYLTDKGYCGAFGRPEVE